MAGVNIARVPQGLGQCGIGFDLLGQAADVAMFGTKLPARRAVFRVQRPGPRVAQGFQAGKGVIPGSWAQNGPSGAVWQ